MRLSIAPTARAVVVGAAIAASLVLSLPHLAVVHGRAVENSARNLLTSLPPNAVVIHSQDEFHGALNYLQAARGERATSRSSRGR